MQFRNGDNTWFSPVRNFWWMLGKLALPQPQSKEFFDEMTIRPPRKSATIQTGPHGGIAPAIRDGGRSQYR
jgi:hypothetical protein